MIDFSIELIDPLFSVFKSIEELWPINSSILKVLSLVSDAFSPFLIPGSGNSPKLGGRTRGAFFSTKNSSLLFF